MAWRDEEGNKEPPFIKLYLDDLSRLSNLTAVQRTVLDLIMKYSSYGNEVVITKKVKKSMLSQLGIADSSFKNALAILVKRGILFKGDRRSIYVINPSLAFKGKINERTALIIRYNGEERESISLEVLNDGE